MAKDYEVSIPCVGYVTVWVEANNREEAVKKAFAIAEEGDMVSFTSVECYEYESFGG